MSVLITIEGIEGVGKSTCMAFVKTWLAQHQYAYCTTREPGGTRIGEAIRELLLQPVDDEVMADETELLLMFAARAQHMAQVIRPALLAGRWVVCDRFVDASYAYQGGGRGIPTSRIESLEKWLLGSLQPDLTILLDAPVELALHRAKLRQTPDRIEAETHAFFQRVQACYRQRAEQYPERFRLVDASQSLDVIKQQINQLLDALAGQCQKTSQQQ